MHTRPLTPSFQDTVGGGTGGKRENRRSSAPGTREWGQRAPAQGRYRTRCGRHAGALGVEDWGPRYFRGRLRSIWAPQTSRPVTQELSSTLGLLAPALTPRPGRGCSLNNLSRPRLQLYRRACWVQGWATRYQPPPQVLAALPFLSSARQSHPKGRKSLAAPGPLWRRQREPMAPRVCAPPFREPQGHRGFGTARQRPLIPKPAPWTWTLPPSKGHTLKLERNFCALDGEGGTNESSTFPARPTPPKHAQLLLQGRNPGTRAPWSGCRKSQPFLALNFFALSREREQRADGSHTQHRPPPRPPPLAARRRMTAWPRP